MGQSQERRQDSRTVRPNGPRIKELRKIKFGSREEFRDALGGKASDIKLRRLGEIERGTAMIFPHTLHAIARTLGVAYESLLATRADAPSPPSSPTAGCLLLPPTPQMVPGPRHHPEAAAPTVLALSAQATQQFPHVPHQVPAPPPDFVGRCEDLAALLAAFGQGACIVGARGLGGVGKTSLALVLAQYIAPRFPDGQIYLDLRGAGDNPVSWRDATGHVIHSYLTAERLPNGDDALLGLYRTVLHGKQVLLVMDNASDASQVAPLLPPEGCALLITSRQRFALPGLLVRDLGTLPPADAIALLRKIAPRVGQAAGEIATLCGHLPLALRLAGMRLVERDDLSVEDYLERLRSARLSERSGLAEVAATLRVSEEMLPGELRGKWRELAVFVGGFETGWAAAVWDMDEQTADDWLGTLRRRNLIEWSDDTHFYRLHDLVREYAVAQMDHPMRDAALRRHARCFYRIACAAGDEFRHGVEKVPEATRDFARIWDEVQIAEKLKPNNINFNTCTFLYSKAKYLIERGNLKYAEIIFQQVLNIQMTCKDNTIIVAEIYRDLAFLYFLRGDPEKCEASSESAFRIWEVQSETVHLGIAETLHNLGLCRRWLQQSIAEAEQLYRLALQIAEQQPDPVTLFKAHCLHNLAGILKDHDQYTESKALLLEALRIRQTKLGTMEQNTAQSIHNLGCLYSDWGRLEAAETYLRESLRLRECVLGRRHHSTAQSLHSLGRVYQRLKKNEEAEQCYQRALNIRCEVLGVIHPYVAETLEDFATFYRDIGRCADAEVIEGRLRESRKLVPRRSVAPLREFGIFSAENYSARVTELCRRLAAGPSQIYC